MPLALLAILLLSGCSSGPEAKAIPDGATDTTGLLRGVVVDEAVRPVAGASVNVTGEGVRLNATTGDDGLFRFTGLAPGTYVVEAGKRYYAAHQQAVTVLAGVQEPDLAKFQLVFERAAAPFAQVYKYEGYFECGNNAVRVCANVNIATWIVLCAKTEGQVCLGNVTGDHSLFFQAVDPGPSFIQAELLWDATSPLGTELSFLIGGGNEEELKQGVSLPAYNNSMGPSPLMVRVSNHEGPEAWCRNVPDPPCEEEALRGSGIGSERALLGQVDAGPSAKTPACVPAIPEATQETCGVGWSMQQAFVLYTTVFYGYEPPLDWLFATTGAPPAPPS